MTAGPTAGGRNHLEVVFRAMWQDGRDGIHELAAGTFRGWAQSQHPQLDVARAGGDGEAGAAVTASKRGSARRIVAAGESDADAGYASGAPDVPASPASADCRLDLTRETSTDGGVTTTTLELVRRGATGVTVVTTRVLSDAEGAWLWVDVEVPAAASSARDGSLSKSRSIPMPALGADHASSQPTVLRETGAASLVHELLDAGMRGGGRPHVGPEPLSVDPVQVRDAAHTEAIRNAIVSPQRPVPYLVIAWDPINPDTAMGDMTRRAHSAASQLAGLARVFVMPLALLTRFQRLVGGELDLQPGEARLYLTGSQDPHRHRTLSAELLRSDPHQAGRWASALLRLALAEREPPPLYGQARARLGSQRQAPMLEAGPSPAERIAALESERDDLWEALFETREQRAAAREQRDEISQQVLDMQEELHLAQLRADDLQRQLVDAQDQMVEWLLQAGQRAEAPDTDASKRKYQQVTSIRQALQLARANLSKIEIPPAAEHRIADLDSAIESHSWALSVFDGLLALEAYANTGAEFQDFRDWCRRSKHQRVWFANAKKLAMNESEEVMRQPELRKYRLLPVAVSVAPAGHIEMQAHLKLSNASFAPRLYFHDATRGRNSTGKVHVGYIGPHLPTKRFRS